jgi:hypothetical protein
MCYVSSISASGKGVKTEENNTQFMNLFMNLTIHSNLRKYLLWIWRNICNNFSSWLFNDAVSVLILRIVRITFSSRDMCNTIVACTLHVFLFFVLRTQVVQFCWACSFLNLSIECMRGRPSRPLHRDLQWSIVLEFEYYFLILLDSV